MTWACMKREVTRCSSSCRCARCVPDQGAGRMGTARWDKNRRARRVCVVAAGTQVTIGEMLSVRYRCEERIGSNMNVFIRL